MTHLVFAASGIKQDLDLYEKFLETRAMMLPIKDKKGKVTYQPIQSQLRPIRLYDYIFPKQHLDSVLNTLRPETKGVQSSVNFKGGQLPIALLRKGMKLKKIPKWDDKATKFFMPPLWVRNVGIGVRSDADIEKDGLTYEGL